LISSGPILLAPIFVVFVLLLFEGIPVMIALPLSVAISLTGWALLLRAVPRVNLSVEEEAFIRFYPAYTKLERFQRKPDTSTWSSIKKSLAKGAEYVSRQWKAEYLDISNKVLEPALGPVREKIANRLRYGIHSKKPEDVNQTIGVLKAVLQYVYDPKGLDHLKMLDKELEKLPVATGEPSTFWRSSNLALTLPIIPAILLFVGVILFGPEFGADKNTGFSVAVIASVTLYGILANLLRRKR
jgi:hypothetical protein